MSNFNIFKWIGQLVDRVRDMIAGVDPDRFKTKYQTVVIPEFGVVNRNGRIYTREIAERMCGQFREPLAGEIGHPSSAVINISSVSHRIHSVFIDEDMLWVEYSVVDNPQGRLLYDLFQKQGQETFVLSPRGVGSVPNDGNIAEDHEVIAYDFIPIMESSFRPYSRAEVIARGKEVFDNEQKLYDWLEKEHELFGGQTPQDLINEGLTGKVMTALSWMKQEVV